jgi:peptidoglycan/xylan/chitin deacetylase (PgdA/CDA1 family)
MKKILLAFAASLLLAGCVGSPFATATSTATLTDTPLPPTATATVTRTPTITPTFTASPLPTATWVAQGPDHVIVPILLYHRIAVSPIGSRYYVTPETFDGQMKLLHDWGYETITIDMLLNAIYEGAELPPRPIILTLDDGHLDNYTTALPILEKYGFTAIEYVVYNFIGVEGYMDVEQLRELVDAGWELGSHSLNHRDIPKLDPALQRSEVVDSRTKLEEALGVPIRTFAYPYGAASGGVIDYVHFAGYIAGMGLGYTADQGNSNIFYLQRREIYGHLDVRGFANFLPWQGDPAFFPTIAAPQTATPTFTPTQTETQIPTATP